MNKIQKLRKRTGLSQSQFAKKFNIPVRTLQNWEIDKSVSPEYIPSMLERILNLEEELSAYRNKSNDGND